MKNTEITSAVAAQLIRGSRNIDRMREDIRLVLSLVSSGIRFFEFFEDCGKRHVLKTFPPRHHNGKTVVWTLSETLGEKESRRIELKVIDDKHHFIVDHRVDDSSLPASLVQHVYDSLDVLVTLMLEENRAWRTRIGSEHLLRAGEM